MFLIKLKVELWSNLIFPEKWYYTNIFQNPQREEKTFVQKTNAGFGKCHCQMTWFWYWKIYKLRIQSQKMVTSIWIVIETKQKCCCCVISLLALHVFCPPKFRSKSVWKTILLVSEFNLKNCVLQDYSAFMLVKECPWFTNISIKAVF